MCENEDEFKSLDILGFSNYEANMKGIVRNKNDKTILTNSKHNETKKLYVRIKDDSNTFKRIKLETIISSLFVYNDDPLNKKYISYKDNNYNNVHALNLEWTNKSRKTPTFKNEKGTKYSYILNKDGTKEYLEENYKVKTNKEMAKELNCNECNIAIALKYLGLFRRNTNISLIADDEVFINMEKLNFSRYWISNYGRIRNKDNVILNWIVDDQNIYPTVRLVDDNGIRKETHYKIHILVAKMFIENDDPINKTEVNHIDGNKLNPYYKNLEWITPSGNKRHAINNNLRNFKHHSEDEIRNVCKLLEEGKTSTEIFRLLNNTISYKVINMIKNHKSWCKISKEYNF